MRFAYWWILKGHIKGTSKVPPSSWWAASVPPTRKIKGTSKVPPSSWERVKVSGTNVGLLKLLKGGEK
jgi:hypothetical protein